MKILCVMLAVAIVLATAFFILKYHILMNLALNARTKNLLAARGNETLSDREQEIRRQMREDGEWLASLPREDLEILSRDGLRLVGHYVHTQGNPGVWQCFSMAGGAAGPGTSAVWEDGFLSPAVICFWRSSGPRGPAKENTWASVCWNAGTWLSG